MSSIIFYSDVVYSSGDVISYEFDTKKELVTFNEYLNKNFTDKDIKAVVNTVFFMDTDNVKDIDNISKYPKVPNELTGKFEALDTTVYISKNFILS